jgi:redox-sensing transcriptional repressor
LSLFFRRSWVKEIGKISQKVIPRLSRYYRILFEYSGSEVISSKEVSDFSGYTAAQVRKDLAYFGQFGRPGRGYNVKELRESIRKILGLDRKWNIALVGVGNLGIALLGYKGFKDQGFEITAAFDNDPAKAGAVIKNVEIFSISRMWEVMQEKKIDMIILTVPRESAQAIAFEAVECGAKAVLNFAPINLKLPDSVKVRNIDMSIEIENLSFLISKT